MGDSAPKDKRIIPHDDMPDELIAEIVERRMRERWRGSKDE